MPRTLVLDAYNIINAWPELMQVAENGMDLARDKLIEIMVNYSGFTGDKIKVVFDAHQVKKGKGNKENIDGVEVVYTKYGETADQYIEKMAREVSLSELYVVTGDQLEQRVTFGHGASRMTPHELITQITSAMTDMQEVADPQNSPGTRLFQGLDMRIREVLEKWRRGGK